MFSIIKSGMASAMHDLSIISNNVANSNSNGFKKSLASFADLGAGRSAETLASKTAGQGVLVEDKRLSFSQGSIVQTEQKTDLALQGNGYFILRNPNDAGVSFSRNGSFALDANGFLKTDDNCFVLGTPLIDGAFAPDAAAIDALLPIRVPGTLNEAPISDLSITENGQITAKYGNQEAVPLGAITLGVFSNPAGLLELGNSRFGISDNSGNLTLGAPTDAGYATLLSGGLETSNVEITEELTAMIKAQQQFNGSARIMQTNSDMIEKLTR
jgi:flagellar hook protein FlgE